MGYPDFYRLFAGCRYQGIPFIWQVQGTWINSRLGWTRYVSGAKLWYRFKIRADDEVLFRLFGFRTMLD
jgi:hypothetical protein